MIYFESIFSILWEIYVWDGNDWTRETLDLFLLFSSEYKIAFNITQQESRRKPTQFVFRFFICLMAICVNIAEQIRKFCILFTVNCVWTRKFRTKERKLQWNVLRMEMLISDSNEKFILCNLYSKCFHKRNDLEDELLIDYEIQ